MEFIPAFASYSTYTSELFLDFNNDSSNVIELCSQLAQCPGFCEATFATGNLDLAGKGIRISIIIQGSLAILIGAIFPILIYLISTLPIRHVVPHIPLLQDIKQKIHKINFFFIICLLMSITLHSMHNSRPILETVFLSSLVNLEMSITSVFYWGMMIDKEINANPFVGTLFAYLGVVLAQWFLPSKISVPHRNFYRMLAHGCRPQPTAAVGLTPSLDNVTTTQGFDIKTLFGGETSGKQAFLWVLCFYLIGVVVFMLSTRFENKLPGWLRRHGKAIGWALFLTLQSTGLFRDTWASDYRGQLVQKMRRKDLPTQNDWDFGQTTALMIWLLVASEIFTTIWKWRSSPVATPEKNIVTEVEKAVEAPVKDDLQQKLEIDECGKLMVKTSIPVEHDLS